ncbi:MAG: hypothetical protein JJ872_06715 [Marivivens sp.]|nr:hypothetical protein [Marivivens sp.]
MKQVLKITAAISLVLLASNATSQESDEDYADARIRELWTQGYTHFRVSRGGSTTTILAYGNDLEELEIEVSNEDGDILGLARGAISKLAVQEAIKRIAAEADTLANEAPLDVDAGAALRDARENLQRLEDGTWKPFDEDGNWAPHEDDGHWSPEAADTGDVPSDPGPLKDHGPLGPREGPAFDPDDRPTAPLPDGDAPTLP